jgi:RNA polymerase sigma factor (sigma-70 family)
VVEQTDRELVTLSRQGNKEAFGYLMERYQMMVRQVALRMVMAEDVAQDLSQETMLQAYLSLKDLRDEERFRSWLYGIVLNVTKSYLRIQKQQRNLHLPLNDDQVKNQWDADRDSSDPQEIAIERELHFLVLDAIEELPKAHRESARLYYYESLTLHEITAITGASPEAIKVRLHRARNHLREKLQNAYPEFNQEMTANERRRKMIKTIVADILVRDDKYIVILQDEAQEKMLPIWIGPFEGSAIAMGLRAYPTPRPMTFDFMAHLLNALDAKVEDVRIEVLKDMIFYGTVKVRIGKKIKEVDARPSDVLALAVRTGSPIYVAEEVMQQASKDRDTYENEFGRFTPGEGVEAIIKEFEEGAKKYNPTSLQSKEEHHQSPEE